MVLIWDMILARKFDGIFIVTCLLSFEHLKRRNLLKYLYDKDILTKKGINYGLYVY